MNIKDVDALAELAKLDMSTDEKEAMLKDMSGILEYVKVIEGVKVEDVTPTYKDKNVWREDLLTVKNKNDDSFFSSDLIIKQFPESQDGFLKVKKIL